jgi:hypothetical protein
MLAYMHAAPSVARGTVVRLHVVCCRDTLRLGRRSSGPVRMMPRRVRIMPLRVRITPLRVWTMLLRVRIMLLRVWITPLRVWTMLPRATRPQVWWPGQICSADDLRHKVNPRRRLSADHRTTARAMPRPHGIAPRRGAITDAAPRGIARFVGRPCRSGSFARAAPRRAAAFVRSWDFGGFRT